MARGLEPEEELLQEMLRRVAADPTNRDAALLACGLLGGQGTSDPRAAQVTASWQGLYPEHRAPATLEAVLAAALLRLADQASRSASAPKAAQGVGPLTFTIRDHRYEVTRSTVATAQAVLRRERVASVALFCDGMRTGVFLRAASTPEFEAARIFGEGEGAPP